MTLPWGVFGRLFRDIPLRQHPRQIEGILGDGVVAARGAAVAGAHIRFQQQGIAVRLVGAQLGHIFRRFPVHDLAVVEARRHQHGRIILARNVVVGRVAEHVVVGRLLVRIAPFQIFARRQRQAGVHHGIHHVDEGHGRVHGVEQLGTHVDDGAHQQAAGAAALDDEAVRARPFFAHQVVGAVDEVIEGVFLLHQHAVFMPRFAHVRAAADVRLGIDDAPIQQAQAGQAKARFRRDAVRAIRVQQQRRGAVQLDAFLVDDPQRHLHAVARLHPQALRRVAAAVEAADDFLLFQHRALAILHVDVDDGGRRDGRLVGHAKLRGGILRRAGRRGQVDSIVELHGFPVLVRKIKDARAVQGARLFHHHQVALEEIDGLDDGILVVRHDALPVLRLGRGQGGADDAEILRVLVGDDVQQAVAVLDAVAVAFFARQHAAETAFGRTGRQQQHFARIRAARGEHEEALVLRAAHVDGELFHRLVVHLLRRAAQGQAEKAVRALGGGVFLGQHQGGVVRRPGQRRHAWHGIGEQLARLQILDMQLILAETRRVGGVGQQLLVRADTEGAHGKELVAVGQLVLVQQDFLGGAGIIGAVRADGAAAVERVLLARFHARVIVKVAYAHRHGQVHFLHAALDFRGQLVGQRLDGGRDGRRVGVFRIQVVDHGRIGLFLQPAVVVRDDRAMAGFLPGGPGGHRRDGRGGEGGGGVGGQRGWRQRGQQQGRQDG